MNGLGRGVRTGLVVASLLACATATSAQDATQTPETATSATGTSDASYRIGAGDVLDVSVSKQPDYSRLGVRVEDDGTIQIPRDDEPVVAACRTPREVAETIKGRYARYLRTPYVYVSVKEFNSQPVAVIGAVNAPGRFQLQRRVRLLELITLANGPSPQAGRTVQLVRATRASACPDDTAVARADDVDAYESFDLDATLKATDSSNPFVQPGDVVRLPDAELAYVVGSVKYPKEITLKGPVTLSEAVAAAGGMTSDASADKIRIMRRVAGSAERRQIDVAFDKKSARAAKDVYLEPDDIVEVPGPSGGRKFLYGLKQVLVPAAVQYPIRVIR